MQPDGDRPPLPSELVQRADADWMQAAQLLIDGCTHLPSPQDRVNLLGQLCDALGPALYPALLGVLCVVGERGGDAAKAAVAGALVDALCSGRVPMGQYAAWGASTSVTGGGMKAMRSLGPVEYLCAWYAQPGARAPLHATGFDRNLRALLGLLSQVESARALYCERLISVADDPLDGSLSRATRSGLRQLASAWQANGRDMHAPVNAFLAALQSAQPAASWAGPTAGWGPHA